MSSFIHPAIVYRVPTLPGAEGIMAKITHLEVTFPNQFIKKKKKPPKTI